MTRDASKDASKKPLVLAPNKPADKKPSKAPTSASKPSKPAAKPTPTKSNKERASSRFYSSSSGTYGKSLPSNPKLKSQKKKQTGSQKINAEVAANSGGRITSPGAKSNKKKKRVNRRGRAY